MAAILSADRKYLLPARQCRRPAPFRPLMPTTGLRQAFKGYIESKLYQ
jgi:hypothetical protein